MMSVVSGTRYMRPVLTNLTLSTSLLSITQLHWIKELSPAQPYGFNDYIKGVGTSSSTSCRKRNIYALFNKHPGRNHMIISVTRKPPHPELSINAVVDLVDMTDQREGVHKINTILFFISFPQLRALQELALNSDNYDLSSAEYRVTAKTDRRNSQKMFRGQYCRQRCV